MCPASVAQRAYTRRCAGSVVLAVVQVSCIFPVDEGSPPSGTRRSGLPLRHTAISMAPHRIAPVGTIAAAFEHQRFVDLYTQAGLGEWGDEAVVEPEVLRVQNIVEHFAAPVVVHAQALFL